MLLKLPNELIGRIIQELAADPFGNGIQNPTALIPLSNTCRLLRTLCLPILAGVLNLSQKLPSPVIFSTEWLKNVKYLRCCTVKNKPLIKIVDNGHVIMTGDSTSLVNPRLCPALSSVEIDYKKSPTQLTEVLRSLDAYSKSFPNYSNIKILLKIEFSNLSRLLNLPRPSRQCISALQIEITGDLWATGFRTLEEFPNLESVTVFCSKSLDVSDFDEERNSEEIDSNAVANQLRLIGTSLLSLQKLKHFGSYDTSSTIDLYTPSSLTSLDINLDTVKHPCFLEIPSYPKCNNLTELTIEMGKKNLDCLDHYRRVLSQTNVVNLVSFSKPKLRTLKLITHAKQSTVVASQIELTLMGCPSIVLDWLVISCPFQVDNVETLLKLLSSKTFKSRSVMILRRQPLRGPYGVSETQDGDTGCCIDENAVGEYLACEPILEKVTMVGYSSDCIYESSSSSTGAKIGKICRDTCGAFFSQDQQAEGVAVYKYAGAIPQSYLKEAALEGVSEKLGSAVGLSYECRFWCERDDCPQLPEVYLQYIRGTEES